MITFLGRFWNTLTTSLIDMLVEKRFFEDFTVLSGIPIETKIGPIHQPKLMEIAEIGMSEFNHYVGTLAFDPKDLEMDFGELQVQTFDIIIVSAMRDENFLKKVTAALSFFFKEEVFFHKEFSFFFVGDLFQQKIIDGTNFEELKAIIKMISCVDEKEKKEKEKYNPLGKMAERIAEQQKRAREQIEKLKAKQNKKKQSEFSDLVSAFCIFSHQLPEAVYNLTLYQFINLFKRSQAYEDYEIKIKSMLAGADAKNMDLKHYTERF